ncbi:MAG: hypothetical protein ACON4I_00440 [Candidatus Puniceispirillaceae bacterium]
MTKSNSHEVLCVHTAHGLEDFEIFGGTAKWKINLERAGRCRFVMCAVRAGSMPHAVGKLEAKPRTAFLIGKISKITPVEVGNPLFFMGNKFETEGRSLVEMSEYAKITIPDFWQKGWMTPTIYRPEDEICDMLNMSDLSQLPFRPLRKAKPISIRMRAETSAKSMADPHPERHAKRGEGLTIANAKAGLSTYFGVPIEDIDITIRG